jgi:hypothetical protein
MKRFFAALCFLVCSSPAFSQNWATVSASNITDLNQNKLAAGQLCFLVTDQNDNPISISVGGGGQTLKRPFCSTVAAGSVAAFTVPNPAATSPAGIYYRVTVKDTSTGLEVLRYTQVTFSGATFNFDAYAPTNLGNFAALTENSVSGNLSVSGNASVTGTLAAGSTTITGSVSASGGMVNTPLTGSGSGNSVTLLNEQGPKSAITGNGADQVMYTYTMPSNTMGPGKGIRARCWFKHSTATTTVVIKHQFGGASYETDTTGTTVAQHYSEIIVFNNPGVTNAQHGSNLQTVTNGATFGLNTFSGLTSAVNTTGAVVISITFNVASTDQVTPQQFTVELIQ